MMNISTAFQASALTRSREVGGAVAVNQPALIVAGNSVAPVPTEPDVGLNFEAYQVLRLTGMPDKEARIAALSMRATLGNPEAITPTSTVAVNGIKILARTVAVDVSQLSSQSGNGGPSVTTSAMRLEWNSTEARFTAISVPADPLVLDLTGEGLKFTGADKGKMFDIRGDGTLLMTSWIEGGNAAFLALDRDGNGTIDSGKELFGDQHGAADGFAELAKFDGNQDGAITSDDAVFHMLMLMSPNGKTQGLEQAGITQLHLTGVIANSVRYDGAHETAQSSFTRADGSQGKVHDVWLDVQA